ncbi:unnamed protein product [Dicrocoelium dendriticum]|nr:unnamed protein product [Dicrocoelium dendriticum]
MSFICERHCGSLFKRSVDSLNLLHGFWQRDEALRREDFLTLQRTIDSWYFGFGSPAVAGFLESVADDTGGTTLDTSMHGLIREQIADLMRISCTGPSGDIRSAAGNILLDLKTKKGFRIPTINLQSPSNMISMREVAPLACLKEEPSEDDNMYITYALFREYWFQWGRLENYICVMGFHPEYLECYMKMQAHLFHADLPLPYPDRHYLAVLAASEQRCIYLVLLFARQFPYVLDGQRLLNKLISDCCMYSPTLQHGNLHSPIENSPQKTTGVHLPATELLQRIQSEDPGLEEVNEDVVAEHFKVVVQLNEALDSTHSVSASSRASELLGCLNAHPAIARFLDSLDSGYENFNARPFHDIRRNHRVNNDHDHIESEMSLQEELEKRFAELDTDSDGKITIKEYEEELKRLGLPESLAQKFVKLWDANGDGIITQEEFVETLRTTKW